MSTNIIYKEQDAEQFWKYWNDFIFERESSSRYLRSSLEQNLLFSELGSLFVRDKSFVYLENNKPVGCAFLPIEKRNDFLTITSDINDGYVDSPLFASEAIEKKVFLIIDGIAEQNEVAKIMFTANPIEDFNIKYNYLQKYRYLDTSILKYIIDLNCDDLLKACRKGHRCDIKKMLNDKDFATFSVDKANPSYAMHEEYRELHHKCAGRVTRPKETFDSQFEKLKEGNAVLIGLKYKDRSIAYSYFDFNSDKAIYSSGADDPDYDNLPLYHILLFAAMQYLKNIGVRYIDMEQPSSPSPQSDYYPDKKQLNIALFKRGFGGYFMNQFRGIKYFSQQAFKKDVDLFANKYKIPE